MIVRNKFNYERLLWFLAGAILYLSFGYTEMQGSDLWWHIAAGREIVQTGTLWLRDDWSFSAWGGAWQNHEWLSDLLFYYWTELFGVQSLVYWKWLVVILTFGGLQVAIARQSTSAAAGLVCSAVALAIAAPFIDIRPHLYTLLLFSVLLLMLHNRRAVTWKLILLFLVWVNLHGGFFFGLMALGVLVFPWTEFTLVRIRQAVLLVLISGLACLLNPAGVKSLLFPLTYAFAPDSPFRGIGEWQSPFVPGGIQSPYFFWALVAAPLVALGYLTPALRRRVDIPWSVIFLCALTMAMAVTSRRFIPLFAMSFAAMLGPLAGLALGRLGEEKYGLAMVMGIFAFALYRMVPYPLAAGPAYHYLTAEYTYPVDTLDFMRANRLKGNVFALYNWGGYIHWRTDGDLKVFIDGRADTIYKADTYLEYVDAQASRPGWISRLEQSGAEYVLWPMVGYGGIDKAQELLQTGRWKFVHQDSVSFLLAKTSVMKTRSFAPSPDSAYRQLANARVSSAQGNHAQVIEFANQTRRQIPYQKGACNLLVGAYGALGDTASADAVYSDCRSFFPSNHLRR